MHVQDAALRPAHQRSSGFYALSVCTLVLTLQTHFDPERIAYKSLSACRSLHCVDSCLVVKASRATGTRAQMRKLLAAVAVLLFYSPLCIAVQRQLTQTPVPGPSITQDLLEVLGRNTSIGATPSVVRK